MSSSRLGLRAILLCLLAASVAAADDWPQWGGPQRDGVWREDGIVDRFPAEGPPLRWRAPVGPGFTGPAVAAGRVFLMDRALDAVAPSDVKTQWNYRDKTRGRERVLCLEESSGKVLWQRDYPVSYEVAYGSGPRATPTVCGDRVYALGAMGDLHCLDAAQGAVVWQKSFVRDFGAEAPLYGFASAPLVDGDRLIVLVGGQDQTVVALDRHTGKRLWAAGTASEPGYSAPRIETLGGVRQLIVWHADALAGFAPESGKPLWSIARPITAGIAISTPAVDGQRVVVSSQYEGTMLVEFQPGRAEPEVVWKASAGTSPERQWKDKGFNTTMSTVLALDGHVYGVSLYGEFCCLDGQTGRRVWTTLQPTSGAVEPRERWSTVFMTPHRGRVFLWNDHGELILARLSSKAYEELSRARLLEADMASSGGGGRKVVWSHPAYANRCVYVRNDHEIRCFSLAQP